MKFLWRDVRRRLSLLTWNVWFGLERPHRRWTELLEIVGRIRPDVIAFQEVTDPFLAMLRRAHWVKRTYTLSDSRGEPIEGYGNLIATRLPVHRVEVHPLDSEMERKLVLVEAEAAGRRWAFASAHLESLRASRDLRVRQLRQILDVLSPFENAVLMGDLNFCSRWTEENDRIPPDYLDVWPTIRSGAGFTVDSELNEMRARVNEERKRVRFDRILVRASGMQPAKVKMMGTKPIRGEDPTLFPSDHFGLLAELKVTNM